MHACLVPSYEYLVYLFHVNPFAVQELKSKIDEENRVHAEIESFLRIHIEVRWCSVLKS